MKWDVMHFQQSRWNRKIKKRIDEVREKREKRGDPLFEKEHEIILSLYFFDTNPE